MAQNCPTQGFREVQGEGKKGEREEKHSGRRHDDYPYCLFSFPFHASDFQRPCKQCRGGSDTCCLLSVVMGRNRVCVGGSAHVSEHLGWGGPEPAQGPRPMLLPPGPRLAPSPVLSFPTCILGQPPLSWPGDPCFPLSLAAFPCGPGLTVQLVQGPILGDICSSLSGGRLPCSHEEGGVSVCQWPEGLQIVRCECPRVTVTPPLPSPPLPSCIPGTVSSAEQLKKCQERGSLSLREF